MLKNDSFPKKIETPNSKAGRSFEALITSLIDTRSKFLLGWTEIAQRRHPFDKDELCKEGPYDGTIEQERSWGF
jgi:hypothetical protein